MSTEVLKYRIPKPVIRRWEKMKKIQRTIIPESVSYELIDNYLYYKL
jgi:hypothetical protein